MYSPIYICLAMELVQHCRNPALLAWSQLYPGDTDYLGGVISFLLLTHNMDLGVPKVLPVAAFLVSAWGTLEPLNH